MFVEHDIGIFAFQETSMIHLLISLLPKSPLGYDIPYGRGDSQRGVAVVCKNDMKVTSKSDNQGHHISLV